MRVVAVLVMFEMPEMVGRVVPGFSVTLNDAWPVFA